MPARRQVESPEAGQLPRSNQGNEIILGLDEHEVDLDDASGGHDEVSVVGIERENVPSLEIPDVMPPQPPPSEPVFPHEFHYCRSRRVRPVGICRLNERLRNDHSKPIGRPHNTIEPSLITEDLVGKAPTPQVLQGGREAVEGGSESTRERGLVYAILAEPDLMLLSESMTSDRTRPQDQAPINCELLEPLRLARDGMRPSPNCFRLEASCAFAAFKVTNGRVEMNRRVLSATAL
jgi:hypothetical protein